jgi:hypothetical protein
MNLRVVETQSWPIIEKAATAANTCIRPDGPNNVVAKEAWENNPERIRYFIQESRSSSYQWFHVGYVRLHKVSENFNTALPKLWVVDFAAPYSYRAIRLVRQQIQEPLLAHKRTVDDDDLSADWVTLPLKLTLATEYPFHQCQGNCESGWWWPDRQS